MFGTRYSRMGLTSESAKFPRKLNYSSEMKIYSE